MTRWLLEDGIRVSSERTSDITRNGSSRGGRFFKISGFARATTWPSARFCLGDILARATGISPGKPPMGSSFSSARRLDREGFLRVYGVSRALQRSLAGIFRPIFGNVGLYPLYELVVSIYNRFGLLTHFPDDQGFLMHLLELIKKQEEEYSDITSFLEYFENLVGEDMYVRASKVMRFRS